MTSYIGLDAHSKTCTFVVLDKNGNQIGQFSLDITAPEIGSTVVTIRSTGSIINNSLIQKIIEVKMAIPSFTVAVVKWCKVSVLLYLLL